MARRPVGSIPKLSSAASSLLPPRLTYRGLWSRISTASEASTSLEELSAGAPPTITLPSEIRAWAQLGLATRPRRTNSVSRRRRRHCDEALFATFMDIRVVVLRTSRREKNADNEARLFARVMTPLWDREYHRRVTAVRREAGLIRLAA